MMSSETKEKLTGIGVDLEKTLPIFMNNETFYVKMLNKFPQDKTFSLLKTHMEDKEWSEAFKDAHTLKGLSANLGLGNLYNNVYELTEVLRNPPYDVDKALELYAVTTELYNKALETINSL